LRRIPAFDPTVELPLEIALRLPERSEPDGLVIDGVESGERIDEIFSQPPAELLVTDERGRQFAANDRAAPALHHDEVDVEHVAIGA